MVQWFSFSCTCNCCQNVLVGKWWPTRKVGAPEKKWTPSLLGIDLAHWVSGISSQFHRKFSWEGMWRLLDRVPADHCSGGKLLIWTRMFRVSWQHCSKNTWSLYFVRPPRCLFLCFPLFLFSNSFIHYCGLKKNYWCGHESRMAFLELQQNSIRLFLPHQFEVEGSLQVGIYS